MPAFTLKLTSWSAPSCTQTVRFSGRHTLEDVHGVIRREFTLDDHHPWAFFLSGEPFDRTTEFSRSLAPDRQPHRARLDALGLTAGMRVAYLFDFAFGEGLRHDVDVLEVIDSDAPLPTPEVLSREGTRPLQDARWEDLPEEDAGAQAVEARVLPPGLLMRAEALTDKVALLERSDRRLPPEEGPALADDVDHVLAGVADAGVLEVLGREVGADMDLVLMDAIHALREVGLHARAEAADARLEPLLAYGQRDGFAPELLTRLRGALRAYAVDGATAEERIAPLPPEAALSVAEDILEACPEPARLEELQDALCGREVAELLQDVARVGWRREGSSSLLALTERVVRATGSPGLWLELASTLAGQGRHVEALELARRFEAQVERPGQAARLELARVSLRCGEPERGEAALRALLAERWLSGSVAPEAVRALAEHLERTGRGEEARRAQADARRRQHEARERAGGTFRREQPKVDRNAPCPCGSGKKAKKCCGGA
jgi:hypothetical protein